MKLPKLGAYALILILSVILGLIIEGTGLSNPNGLLSFLFIGCWLCFTFEFASRVKKNREYLSDQNQFILIFGSLFLGTFYAVWGDFNPILNTAGPGISFSMWHLFLAGPYVVIGTIFLFLCVNKYFFVYIGSKSIKSRVTAVLLELGFIAYDITYMATRETLLSSLFPSIERQSGSINILILLQTIVMFLLLVYAIVSHPPSISRLSTARVSNRLSDIDRQIADADRVANQARNQERQARRTQDQRARQRQSQRSRQERARETQRRQEAQRKKREAERAKAAKRKPKASTSSRASTPKTKGKPRILDKKALIRMKPKTGILTEDDFKCIFCFDLPSKSDGHRGIVLCPNCNYPAHVDEFKTWVRTSTLCSRCDGEIPASFRRNPKIISTSQYLQAYKYWKRKFNR